MSLAAHYTAVKSRLNSGSLSGAVEEVVRKTPGGEPVRANYVVLGMDMPALNDARYLIQQDVSAKARYRFDVRSVAVDRAGVLLIAQAVRERLIGHVLTVSNRACDPLRLVEPVEEGRVHYDKAADLFYVDETFETYSRRG